LEEQLGQSHCTLLRRVCSLRVSVLC
jgi:hypothetical protein